MFTTPDGKQQQQQQDDQAQTMRTDLFVLVTLLAVAGTAAGASLRGRVRGFVRCQLQLQQQLLLLQLGFLQSRSLPCI